LDGALDELEASSWQASIPNNQYTTNTADSKSSHNTKQGTDVIDESVATVNASVKEAHAHNIKTGDDEMKEFFNTLFSSFDENTTDEQLEANLKKMMGNFFNVESLKEPVQTIAEKYPRWLEANQDKLEEKELENHRKQCDLYLQVWQKLENKNGDYKGAPVQMEEIMDLLTKTFSYGSLPSEVMDGMMPEELKQFANQMLQLEKDLEKEEKQSSDNPSSKSGDSQKNDKTPQENVDPVASMKFLEQLISAGGAGANANEQNQGDGAKLSADDIKQMQQLMNSDCLLM